MKHDASETVCRPGLLSTIVLVVILSLGVPFSVSAETPQAEADVLVAQGVLAYDAKQYDEALNLLTQAHTLAPQHVRGLYYLGITYLALQQPGEAIEPLEEARKLQPSDPTIPYQLGVAYFSVNRYDEAGPLFEDVYKQQPKLDNLAYYVGLTRYRQKAYKPAVEAFDSSTITDPSLKRLAKFYRGLALGISGMPKEAAAEFQDIQRTRASDPLTQTAIRLSESMAAARGMLAEEKRFHASISLGGYYDDNVAINPDKCPKCIPAVNSLVDSFRARRTNSPGGIAAVNADYSFFRQNKFESNVSYSFLQTYNATSEVRTFNIQSHQAGLHNYYRDTIAEMPFQLALDYSYDYVFLGRDIDMKGFLSRHNPTLSATLVEPSTTLPLFGSVGHMTTVLTRYQIKGFSGEFDPRFPSEQRDGYNMMAGLFHTFRFASDQVLLRTGYEYDNETTDGTSFSYQGHRLESGVQTRLPWDLSFGYTFSLHLRDYKNSQTIFLDKDGALSRRYDMQYDHIVQLTKALSEHWLITAQFSRTSQTSNVPVYDYTKNVATGLVTWIY